ncbi:MAG: hypothetical protein HC916_12365 [Coleofasciculaceae cyanobacterium SM2_1_6]|nr:hypothetical protein [Coleofasciculaceae cyanobacterium SM2_1_6]
MPQQTRLREQRLHRLHRRNSRRQPWGQPTPWLLGLGGFSLILLWHWQLFLATGSGISVMAIVYLMQQGYGQHYWQELERLSAGNRQMAVAVGSGAIASIGCYLAIAIYLDSPNGWIATGKLLQGGSTVGIFLLLLWQMAQQKSSRQGLRTTSNHQAHDSASQYTRALENLTAPEPLKRLIAVQQLSQLAIDQELTALQYSQGAECIRLLISLEPEPAVQTASFTALQALEPATQKLAQPLVNLPLQPQKRPLKIE